MAEILPFKSRLDREIQKSDRLTEEEKIFVADLKRLTDDEIIEKYGDEITYHGEIWR